MPLAGASGLVRAVALGLFLGLALLGCFAGDIVGGAVDGGVADGVVSEYDGSPDAGGASEPDAATSSEVDLITFNWPSRYGPTPGVDSEDDALWPGLAAQATVMALQEAGWIAGWIRNQDWEVHRPNPPGDSDDQPVGNLLVWNPLLWETLDTGWHQLSPRTRIQEEAAGPTWHRPKYVVWARLRNREDGIEWVFGSVHFVPSKHLLYVGTGSWCGGA